MRSGAEIAAAAGADLIDINMGCPVPKVRKTGAGAQLLRDPELALDLARAAREGSGLPVTVKLRSGISPGDRSGFDLAIRLAEEAGVSAIGFHPRAATKGHAGKPDYALTRELTEHLDVPVIVSGGLSSAEAARRAYEESGADAVMIARGSLGNPWVFEELTGRRDGAAEPRPRSPASCSGWSTGPRSTSGRSAPSATCASSTPGTSRVSAPPSRSATSCSGAPTSPARGS